MKMIAVQTIIYDVYLAKIGNCDIGTSHECETVGLKQHGTEQVQNSFIAWCSNVHLQELFYILLVMNL